MSIETSSSVIVERLRSKKVIGELFAGGLTASSRSIAVRYLHRDGSIARVAVISAKRLGSAVVRNRIRRRIRAAVRDPEVVMLSGDWAVLARSNISEIPFGELKGAVNKAVQRVRKVRHE